MTSLAQQLQRLALPQSSFGNLSDKSRPSLLFDSKTAATFDKDFFYALGLNGFQELCGLDASLHERYFQSLFSEEAAGTERTVKSKSFNKELDKNIQSFLLQLSPYFLLKPAQKCLEWLLYRFRIHTFNTNSLMKCSLPFFGTNQFVLVVQLISRENVNWSWISEAQGDGTSMAMKTLVTYSSKNLPFLEFLCNTLLETIKIHPAKQTGSSWKIRGILNLYSSIVLGVVHKMGKIPETFLLHIMPVVLKGIKSKFLDFQASSLMIISQLAVTTKLDANALTSILNITTKHCLPKLHKDAINMIALLCQTQDELKKLPKSSFRRMSAMERFTNQVICMSSSQRTQNFLTMYFDSLVPRAFAATDNMSSCDSDEEGSAAVGFSTIFKSLVEETQLTEALQARIFKLLILNHEKHEMSDVVKQVTNRMQQKYPTTFDKILSQCIDKGVVSSNVLNSFLNASLASAKHQLLPNSSMTLSIALMHPEPAIRMQAIRSLTEELSGTGCSAETREFACQNVLQILELDSNAGVVSSAVQLVEKHFELFEDSVILGEKLVNVCKSMWDDASWDSTIQKCMECLTSLSFTNEANSSKEMSEKRLKSKITLLVLTLFTQSACFGESFEKQKLCQTLAASSFVKKDLLLKLLSNHFVQTSEKSKEADHFTEALSEVMEKQNLQECVFNLLETLIPSKQDPFTNRMLIFLFALTNQFKNIDVFSFVDHSSSLLSLLIQFTQSSISAMQDCGSDSVLSKSSLPDLITRLFDKAGNHQEAAIFLVLHVWNNMISKIPKFTGICSCSMLQNREHSSSKETLLKCAFKTLLDLNETVSLLKNNISAMSSVLLQTFMDELFVCPSDAMLFLCDVCLDYLCSEWQEFTSPPNHCVLALRIALDLLKTLRKKSKKSSPGLSDLLKSSSFVIPSILLACTSTVKDIRSLSVQLLEVFIGMSNCPAVSMIKYLSCHFEEIVLDELHCPHALSQYFNFSDTSKAAKIRKQRNDLLKDFLTGCVTSLSGSNQFYVGLKFYEECLAQVDNALEEEILTPCIDKILDKNSISIDECIFMSIFLRKLTSNMSSTEDGEKLYVKALQASSDKFSHVENVKLHSPYIALELLQGKFFASLRDVTKEIVIQSLIEIKAKTTQEDIAVTAYKSFKSLTVHSRFIINQLMRWFNFTSPTMKKGITTKRARVDKATILKEKEMESSFWKEFVVMLELLHHKKRIQKPQDLIGPFFEILMRIIDGKISADNADYVTLMLLGCLLNVFDRSKNLGKDVINDIQAKMKVELLVKCIQSTENAQTHHHALMLLAKSTQYCPEKVLHSVMSIFTFMGNTLLRRDDSYSFQVITKTIQTVIPPLLQLEKKGADAKIKGSVLGVLRVFIDSLPHIPNHRRLIVFEELLTRVGAEEFLWQTIVLMLDQHVCNLSKGGLEDTESQKPRDESSLLHRKLESSMHLWTTICQLFSCDVQIHCVLKMIAYLQTCIDLPEKSLKSKQGPLIDVSKRSTNQIRRFRIIMLTLASQMVKLIQMDREDSDSMTHAQDLFEHALLYLEHITKSEDGKSSDEVAQRYQKTVVRRVNDLLEKINSLLPFENFLSLLVTLLTDPAEAQTFVMKQKAIYLFHIRASKAKFSFSETEEKLLFRLSDRFLQMLSEGSESLGESEQLLHTASLGLTQIVKITSQNKPSNFVPVQPMICNIISTTTLSDSVLSSLLTCLGEITVNLKAHSIVNLAKISPCLLELLDGKQTLKSEIVLSSLLTVINKLFTCLGHFLTPFVDTFLAKLSVLSYLKQKAHDKTKLSSKLKSASSYLKRPKRDSNTGTVALDLVSSVLSMISSKLPSRVLVPAFRKAYCKLLEDLPLAASSLLPVVRRHFTMLEKQELSLQANNLMDFYLHCMEFRFVNKEIPFADISLVEDEALEGAILLLIKLPESLFRPLYMKFYDWGCLNSPSLQRVTTFYKCTSLMSAKLKGLFEIFAVDLVDNITKELEAPLDNVSERVEMERIDKLSHVVDTLAHMLTYSSNKFLTQERFEKIIHPLVNQLEIDVSDQKVADDYISKHVIRCVGQLASSSRDNVTWQPLNYQILMKTRHSSPQVRCHALECLQAIVDKLGDDYLLLLPETIPFLAELLEDESDTVEECCQRVIKSMEERLGEQLQKYF